MEHKVIRSEGELLPTAQAGSRAVVAKIFIGPFGLRSGWRWLLFILLAVGLMLVLTLPGHKFKNLISHDIRPLIDQSAVCLSVFIATWVFSRVDRKPFSSFGLQPLHLGRNLALGIVSGFLSLSLLMWLLIACHAFRPVPVSLTGSAALLWGLFWLLVFILVAFTEELLTRGYPLFALSQGIGFWPAAIGMSVFFGAGHLGNRGEDYTGIAAAMLVGVVLAFSLWWTGSLWWAIGYHLAWDWAETFFYGVADSGQPSPQHLWSGFPTGSTWLSGGSVGPEGSVLALPILLLLALLVRFTVPRGRVAGLERRRAGQHTEQVATPQAQTTEPGVERP